MQRDGHVDGAKGPLGACAVNDVPKLWGYLGGSLDSESPPLADVLHARSKLCHFEAASCGGPDGLLAADDSGLGRLYAVGSEETIVALAPGGFRSTGAGADAVGFAISDSRS